MAGFCCFAHASDEVARRALVYDASVGWFEAGTVAVNVETSGANYELHGHVRTSGPIERFFRWRGEFAAVGTFDSELPLSTAYLLIEDKEDERKVTLASGGKTTIHRLAAASKEVAHPRGSDLMSVLFLSGACFDTRWVHDGEDSYRVSLIRREQMTLDQGDGYASGAAEVCHYDFLYESGDKRRVEVWLTQGDQRQIPAKIRVRVPFRPDGMLKLRRPSSEGIVAKN